MTGVEVESAELFGMLTVTLRSIFFRQFLAKFE